MPKRKFKIAIDVSPLTNGNSNRGVGSYVRSLVPSLQQEIKNNPMYRDFSIQLITDKSLMSSEFDLIHYPYFDPFFLTLPPTRNNQKRIVSVHDLIPLQFPEHFPAGIKGTLKWWRQKSLVRQSDYIITISHTSKHIIADILKYPADKIFVTYLAANQIFQSTIPTTKLNQIKRKYQLPDKFIFYSGDVNWNKNIPLLLKACISIKIPLVLTAGPVLQTDIANNRWTQDIIWLQQQKSSYLKVLGNIPFEDLPCIFKLATVYCQPSFAEGFGLGLVEAMQVGTPVVYSQESCLPEIMDFSGVPIDPYSQKSLEKGLTLLLTDQKLRQKCIRAGYKRCQIFSWKNTALGTLAVYRLALLNERT